MEGGRPSPPHVYCFGQVSQVKATAAERSAHEALPGRRRAGSQTQPSFGKISPSFGMQAVAATWATIVNRW